MTKQLLKGEPCRQIRLVLAVLLFGILGCLPSFSQQEIPFKITTTSNGMCSITGLEDGYEPSGDLIIPEEITQDGQTYKVISIAGGAFSGCSRLTSIEIPNSITSIGSSAFSGCSGLTKAEFASIESLCAIRFGDFYANPLKFAHHLYINGEEITELVIPVSVESIGRKAFEGCSSLISVTIPNSVTSIGSEAFRECSGMTSVSLGNSIETIGSSAFYDCSSLTSILIPNSVTLIGSNAFDGCKSLTSIDIPNSVKSIEECTFRSCSGLTSVRIPNSVTEIGEYAFDGCSALTKAEFESIESLCAIRFAKPNANPLFYAHHLYINGVEITELIVPDGVESIGKYAFMKCQNLTTVEAPTSIASIGERAFEDCTSLTKATLKEGLQSIGARAFFNCSGLTSINIPNSVTSIGYNAFNDCTALTKAEFASIESLCKMRFGTADSNPLYYAHHLYINGEEITELIIPEGVESINDNAFVRCSDLTSIIIPNSITSIGNQAFIRCSGLTSIEIPNSVTSIGYSAFENCVGLTSVIIPNSVAEIGYDAFAGCSGLTSVYYNAEEPISGYKSIFESDYPDYDLVYTNATLYVPESAVEKCKEIEPWKYFKNIEAYDFDNPDVVKAESVKLDKEADELMIGETTIMTASVLPENATNKSVTWSSSDETIATVDENGLVTALQPGSVTIKATTANGLEATCVITVVAKVIEAEGIELNMPVAEVIEGDIVELTATIIPAETTDKTVIWSSSDETVATVDQNGTVTALKAGKATITAKSANGKEATCVITVVAKVIEAEGIELNMPAAEVVEGETVELTATITPAETTDKSVTWSSSDETVVTVDQTGLVTALKAGKATITAETANGLKATCLITVETKTGVDGVDADAQISVVARDGVIVVTAPDDAEVEVYSLTGMRVAKTREHRVEGLSKGVYIVTVSGKAFKVIVG